MPVEAAVPPDAAEPLDGQVDGGTSEDSGSSEDGGSTDPGPEGPLEPIAGALWTAFAVGDAAISRPLGLIIMVSRADASAVLFDTSTHQLSSIALTAPGIAVSVSPSGQRAAVGHNGMVSIIDLISRTVVAELDTTANVFDLALAENGFVYVSGDADQWTNLLALDIENNTELIGPGLYECNHLQVHPNGRLLYTVDTLSSPIDLESFDISGGSPVTGPRHRYHGRHRICGELFLSSFGDQILNGCGTTFHLSSDPAVDRSYRGSVEYAYPARFAGVWHADESPTDRMLAVIPQSDTGMKPAAWVYIHEPRFLTTRNVLATPGMEREGQVLAAAPHFVFFDADGVTLHTVLVAPAVGTPAQDYFHVMDWRVPAARDDLRPAQDKPAIVPSTSNVAVLGMQVIDAEYDDQHDRIVAVSVGPNELAVIDPGAPAQRRTVPLALAPRAVSLAPDRATAAVAHDAWISIVDLSVPEVVDIWPLSEDLFDVVLAGNGHAYGFPSRGDINELYSVDLDTGSVTAGPVISELTRAYLHPDGDRMYGTDRSGRFGDVQRFDLTDPARPTTIGSPYAFSGYSDGYPLCDDLWLSQDGSWAFTACGHIFRLTSDLADDRWYATTLTLLKSSSTSGMPLLAADHSVVRREVAVARDSVREPNVVVYDDAFFVAKASVSIPSVGVAASAVTPLPKHLFYSQAGSHLYLLAEIGSPALLRRTVLMDYTMPAPSLNPPVPDPAVATPRMDFVPFDGVPTHAAYSTTLDTFAILIADPPTVLVHTAGSTRFEAVALPKVGTRVTIDPTGRKAAVGHYGFVTSIDLASRQLVSTQAIPTQVADLGLTADGWVYVAGGGSSIPSMHALNLSTGAENHWLGQAFTDYVSRFVLTADGTRGYGVPYQGSLTRFDVVAHMPQALRPQGGTARDGIWITDDDTRVVTGAGTVWQIAPDAASDRILVGQLESGSRIADVDHASGRGMFAFVSAPGYSGDPPTTEVHFVDDTTFATTSIVTLPKFAIAGEMVAASGSWLAFDSTEQALHVIVRAPVTAANGNEFAVLTVPVP